MIVALTPSIRGQDDTHSMLFGFSHVDISLVRVLPSAAA